MKKIILIIATLISTFIACDRELEFGSDFDFKFNNIDDTDIFINTVKTFQLEIFDIKNVIDNNKYQLSYKVSGGNLILKKGTITLIEGNYYPVESNNLNLVNLDLIPQSSGTITLEVKLKDNNGFEKVKEILVYCTDQNFSFTFTGVVPTPNGTINSGIPFSLNLTNTGLSQNQFQLKYITSSTGNVLINGNTVNSNQYFNVLAGSIQGLYVSTVGGPQEVTFTCKDANAQEIQVVLNFNFSAPPFTLTKISDFSVKNTLQKEFKFLLTNTVAQATYQVRFTSTNPANIFKTTQQQTMNTWIDITLNSNNIYEYIYEANSDVNDNLVVEIKDSYGQIQSINYNVTIFAKPIITNQAIVFTRLYSHFMTFPTIYISNYATRSNVQYTMSGGATLEQTKIFIKNKITGNFDTILFNGVSQFNTLESSTSSGNSEIQSLQNCLIQSKYAGQLYTLQIKDSDGVWSNVYNSSVIEN